MNRFRKRLHRKPDRFQRWWYKRGHRPKPGYWPYSPALHLSYLAMETLFEMTAQIRETRRRMDDGQPRQ